MGLRINWTNPWKIAILSHCNNGKIPAGLTSQAYGELRMQRNLKVLNPKDGDRSFTSQQGLEADSTFPYYLWGCREGSLQS